MGNRKEFVKSLQYSSIIELLFVANLDITDGFTFIYSTYFVSFGEYDKKSNACLFKIFYEYLLIFDV